MNARKMIGALTAVLALGGVTSAVAEEESNVPVVSDVSMKASATSHKVTIEYKLKVAEAVVTVDIQTNSQSSGWVSIGDRNIHFLSGDVNKKIAPHDTATRKITWLPDLSWPDHHIDSQGIRAVVTAWELDNTPDYMVVDLAAGTANTDRLRYYTSAEALPGGLLENLDYRTNKMVFRKVIAKDITWTMGSISETSRGSTETTHSVTLDHNYYIAVFEATDAQLNLVTASIYYSYVTIDRSIRPVDRLSYNRIRNSENDNDNAEYRYPHAPHPKSLLGKLRTMTNEEVDFELPSEAEWEFACRGGVDGLGCEGHWNDGSQMLYTSSSAIDANLPGRYLNNQQIPGNTTVADPSITASNATAIVGSYPPNKLGLYDMHGNSIEPVLDWYADDITKLNGIPNAFGQYCTNGTTQVDRSNDGRRVFKGGKWNATPNQLRAAERLTTLKNENWANAGLRISCRAGLK